MDLSLTLAALAATVSSAAAAAPNSGDFALRIVAVARDGRITDPRLVQARTGIMLRNPRKFTDQPKGSSRMAQWHWPPNRWGVAEVQIDEGGSADPPTTSMSLNLTLTGRPCLSVRDLERAVGRRARFGGTVFPVVLDGPSPGPVQLGDEHATLVVSNGRGLGVLLTAESSRPRRAGCIRSLSLETERKRP